MEKKQYSLCLEVLRRFNKHKLLSEFILIGSWCTIFYEKYFADPDYIRRVSLVTRDMDFLIDKPRAVKAEVDIPELLKDLGFITAFKGQQGHSRLDHPELILEFLTPERGRGSDKPVRLPSLHIRATALRFLNFLTENTIRVKVEDFIVELPHPANFGLHKLIISPRRPKKEKAIKDRDAGVFILKTLMDNQQSEIIASTFQALPKAWRTKIVATLQQAEESKILKLLQSK